MIVDPDFPDHWKTRMLVDLLGGDESAPIYLLRLWAHCQNRRTASFAGLPAAAVKALCRFPGDAADFDNALTTSGFIRRDGASLIVCGWEEHNAGMIANWENGKKGGRPSKKKPKENPSETHGNPMDNPRATHGEPRGEERIGDDKRESERASEAAPEDRSRILSGQARQVVESYPRREKQADALRHVLAQLRDGESFEAMISGTRACAAVIRTLPSGHQNRYVPSAESFFAKMRWKDDPETMRRQGNQQTGSGQMSDEEVLRQLGGRIT